MTPQPALPWVGWGGRGGKEGWLPLGGTGHSEGHPHPIHPDVKQNILHNVNILPNSPKSLTMDEVVEMSCIVLSSCAEMNLTGRLMASRPVYFPVTRTLLAPTVRQHNPGRSVYYDSA